MRELVSLSQSFANNPCRAFLNVNLTVALTTQNKCSALLFAAQRGHDNVILLLLQHGALIDSQDEVQKHPYALYL